MSSNKTSDDITKVTLTLMMITSQVVNKMSFTVNCHSDFQGQVVQIWVKIMQGEFEI